MKKYICIFIMLCAVSGLCIAQEQNEAWNGTLRFNPADLFINLHNAIPGLYTTWTRYVSPNFGIPAEIDINFGWGILPGFEISFLSGMEFIPAGPAGRDKNGLFLDAKFGLSFFFNNSAKTSFITKTNAGYQLITKKGLVFTSGAGIVYNGRSGLGLNVMLDLGFAYKRG